MDHNQSPLPRQDSGEMPDQVFKMNGLRMYLKASSRVPTDGPTVFYSRRGDGPFYLWRFEEKRGQWRSSRVSSGEVVLRELLMATWKTVPSALQTKLGEHYLE
jgi:hypothetical protein